MMSKTLVYSLVAGFVVTVVSATVLYNYVEGFNALISGKSDTEISSVEKVTPTTSSDEEIQSILSEVDTQTDNQIENPKVELNKEANKRLKNNTKPQYMESDIPEAKSY